MDPTAVLPASRFERLLAASAAHPPPRTAVAHPHSAEALGAAREAHDEGLIDALLVGPRARIEALAAGAGIRIDDLPLIDAEHSAQSAALAVAEVRAGRAQAVMKGSLHTDEFLRAVLDRDAGLRTARRASHVYLVDVPGFPRPLLITDAVVNVAPDLAQKRDICQNAIDLAHRLGIVEPRVAVLAAVETVNPAVATTVDAAALCKMADRGQIAGALLDGPLAFDTAIDADAARIKGLTSPVAGHADVLVVPDLETGNILVKQLTFMQRADAAGIVLGTRAPVVLTSRADSRHTRLASCALAKLSVALRRQAPPA